MSAGTVFGCSSGDSVERKNAERFGRILFYSGFAITFQIKINFPKLFTVHGCNVKITKYQLWQEGNLTMRVFHGSDHIVKQPQYMGGKADNDYGNGFYTTEYEDRAGSWAALNGNPKKSIVNVYDLSIDSLKMLDLNEYGVLAWIAEVVSQ